MVRDTVFADADRVRRAVAIDRAGGRREELGLDGAYYRVHHFARQLGSPFPLLAAAGAKTSKIEIGTGVIDMRYENPMYFVEDAGAADLIAGGRLQLGISRGSPEQVIDGWRYFGYEPAEGQNEEEMARKRTELLLDTLKGEGFAEPNPRPDVPQPARTAAARAALRGVARAHLVGFGHRRQRSLGSEARHEPAIVDAEGRRVSEPLHVQQRKQIAAYHEAWNDAGHEREPRVSVSRSIFALTTDQDRAYFGSDRNSRDQLGMLDDTTRAVFGRSYAAEPDILVQELRQDEAIAAADTLLLTIPTQLGVEYNAT